MTIKLVQDDTKPSVYVSLKDPETLEVLDCSGATALLHFRPVGGTLKASVPGVLLTGYVEDDGTVTVTAPYDVAGAGGRVRFDWRAGDLDTAGHFEGEVEITFADATQQTAFGTLRFYIRPQFA